VLEENLNYRLLDLPENQHLGKHHLINLLDLHQVNPIVTHRNAKSLSILPESDLTRHHIYYPSTRIYVIRRADFTFVKNVYYCAANQVYIHDLKSVLTQSCRLRLEDIPAHGSFYHLERRFYDRERSEGSNFDLVHFRIEKYRIRRFSILTNLPEDSSTRRLIEKQKLRLSLFIASTALNKFSHYLIHGSLPADPDNRPIIEWA